MKTAVLYLSLLCLTAGALTLQGCSTDQPGATNTLGFYTTNVNATPDKTTTAAYKACEDLKLSYINSNTSKIDGKVTAKTAQGDDVVIDIAQSGDGGLARAAKLSNPPSARPDGAGNLYIAD